MLEHIYGEFFINQNKGKKKSSVAEINSLLLNDNHW